MLKRNKVLVAFMLVAVLCMSIGFAAVSDNLDVSGKLSMDVTNTEIVKEFDADVYFKSVNETETGVTASVNSSNNDLVEINIDNTILTKVGDSTTIVATIENAGEYAMTLGAPTTVNTAIANYATVTAELAATELASKATTTLTITVKLTAIPKDSFSNYEFSAQVVATPTL